MLASRRQQPLGLAKRDPLALLSAAARRPALLPPRGRRAAAAAARAALPGPLAALLPFGAKAAAAPAAAAAAALVDPSQAFTAATVAVLPVYFAMIAAPKAKLTRSVLESPLLPLLFGIPYAALLWQAWQGGALPAAVGALRGALPLPGADAIAVVFWDPALTAMAWLHLLLLDLLQARAVLFDGLKHLVPTVHSVALCCMFGPLGVLSHLATRWAVHAARGSKVKFSAFS
ncbi:MAG: hypothetical protein J3K34DRAFT_125662 [Monoraphidium minutum]|nr:MAG: hypothetical protein J3K34DRAFT_125662 [Monoraphidium minutum]